MLFYSLILLTIAVDQISKWLVRIHLEVGTTIEILHGVLNFTRFENSGIAFSMLPGYGRLFAPVAFLLTAIVLYYRFKGQLRGAILEMGTAFLVGGAIGNAIDRIIFNQVTDFIERQTGHGILNFADYFINFGVIMILLHSLVFYRFIKK